ncbi:MAG TPA: hypothetical protein VL307_07745 [Chitinophagaceae bacterium]|nr:hypothetical protein [Chitinophagaceae bacterium]
MTEPTLSIIGRRNRYIVLMLALVVPVIIYFYFLPWKTTVAYGDDLYIFRTYASLQRLVQKISIPVAFSKCRPVHGVGIHLLISIFEKNTEGYYFFNIFIQAVNSLLFACIVNIFLRSAAVSLLFGLTIGLTRFAFFNITQLLNGGSLEGLALTFFLSTLFFLVNLLMNPVATPRTQQLGFTWALLFANLAIYTHERYIVLFPFVLLLVWLFPSLKLSIRGKLWVSFLAIASVALNVFIKKAVYGMPFFMGTASTGITLSFAQAFDFLTQGIASIFSINKGPDYLVGLPFTALSDIDKLLVIVLLVIFAGILVLYIRRVRKAIALSDTDAINRCWLFISLIILFGFCLLPAVLTIRLEQRWLQASYAVFILLLIMAVSELKSAGNTLIFRYLPLLFLLLQWVDYNYLRKGAVNSYLSYSAAAAADVEAAVHNNIIHPETRRLFIWEKKRDSNTEEGIKWELGEGYIFNFYEQTPKQLIFVDSVYSKHYPFASSPLATFNRQTDQVIYYDTAVLDITAAFLQDSLRTFSHLAGDALSSYHPFPTTSLTISAADIGKYAAAGFYQNEDGLRWTNGQATLNFAPASVKDSLQITLATFLPPAAKAVVPRVYCSQGDSLRYYPARTSRNGDVFTYQFYFPAATLMQSIHLDGDSINAGPNDKRRLSFPVRSIEIKVGK